MGKVIYWMNTSIDATSRIPTVAWTFWTRPRTSPGGERPCSPDRGVPVRAAAV
jgi:hypothetical protein